MRNTFLRGRFLLLFQHESHHLSLLSINFLVMAEYLRVAHNFNHWIHSACDSSSARLLTWPGRAGIFRLHSRWNVGDNWGTRGFANFNRRRGQTAVLYFCFVHNVDLAIKILFIFLVVIITSRIKRIIKFTMRILFFLSCKIVLNIFSILLLTLCVVIIRLIACSWAAFFLKNIFKSSSRASLRSNHCGVPVGLPAPRLWSFLNSIFRSLWSLSNSPPEIILYCLATAF